MFYCQLKGGLGNQLFQIFAVLAVAIKNKQRCYFLCDLLQPPFGTQRETYWETILHKLKPMILYQHPETHMILHEPMFPYACLTSQIPQSMIAPNKNIKFSGYYQSFLYFYYYFDTIYKMLDFDNQKERILATYPEYPPEKSISLHFRYGDYLSTFENKILYHQLPIAYFLNALLYLKSTFAEFDNYKIYCFFEKGDTELVTPIIDKLKTVFVNSFIPISHNISDYEQMLLMSCMSHNIIANSSFSWWGGMLNTNMNKIVCYPSQWFCKSKNQNTKDMFPTQWKKIMY